MRSTEERFREKYEEDANGCWIWTASQNKGYGLFWLAGANRPAHRVSYEMRVGPIPDGLVIDHLCRTPLCVNPAHMEPVTTRENLHRGIGFAALNVVKTHCPKGHEYTPDNVHVTNIGGRRCKTCMSIRARAYNLAQKAKKQAA